MTAAGAKPKVNASKWWAWIIRRAEVEAAGGEPYNMTALAAALASLPAGYTLIDGEVLIEAQHKDPLRETLYVSKFDGRIWTEAELDAAAGRASSSQAVMQPPEPRPSCWEVLEVPANASPEAVRKAYRAKARILHPDKGGSVEAMTELNNARDEALELVGA